MRELLLKVFFTVLMVASISGIAYLMVFRPFVALITYSLDGCTEMLYLLIGALVMLLGMSLIFGLAMVLYMIYAAINENIDF